MNNKLIISNIKIICFVGFVVSAADQTYFPSSGTGAITVGSLLYNLIGSGLVGTG